MNFINHYLVFLCIVWFILGGNPLWNWYVVCNFHKYYLGKCNPCLNLHIYSTGKCALKIVFLVNKWLKHSGFDKINSNLWRERERGRICNWQVVESPLLCITEVHGCPEGGHWGVGVASSPRDDQLRCPGRRPTVRHRAPHYAQHRTRCQKISSGT